MCISSAARARPHCLLAPWRRGRRRAASSSSNLGARPPRARRASAVRWRWPPESYRYRSRAEASCNQLALHHLALICCASPRGAVRLRAHPARRTRHSRDLIGRTGICWNTEADMAGAHVVESRPPAVETHEPESGRLEARDDAQHESCPARRPSHATIRPTGFPGSVVARRRCLAERGLRLRISLLMAVSYSSRALRFLCFFTRARPRIPTSSPAATVQQRRPPECRGELIW